MPLVAGATIILTGLKVERADQFITGCLCDNFNGRVSSIGVSTRVGCLRSCLKSNVSQKFPISISLII